MIYFLIIFKVASLTLGQSYDCPREVLNIPHNHSLLAEWRGGSVSALPCWRPGFVPRTRLREIIPANNCTVHGQNNWGNWGSPGVMKLWLAWEVLCWLMKFRELCSGGFHPKLVTPPYHGFLNANTPPISQNSKWHEVQRNTKSPSGSIIIGSIPLLIMRSPPT